MSRKVYIQFTDWGGAANKVYRLTRQAFVNKGWSIAITPEESDHIHYTRLLPGITKLGDTQPISITTFGIAEAFKDPDWSKRVAALLSIDRVACLNVLSLDPTSCKIAAYNIPELNPFVDTKMNFMYEPPMEDRELYRKPGPGWETPSNILYFGVYNYSKGADLLLQVAKTMPKQDFFFVGDTRVSTFRFDIRQLANGNATFYDESIPESDMPGYFVRSDIVVLPYRKTYAHDSSAVFLQAMMARKYVVVPNIPPFANVLMEYDVGVAFEPENLLSLRSAIKECMDKAWNKNNHAFDRYLERVGTWDNIAGEA